MMYRNVQYLYIYRRGIAGHRSGYGGFSESFELRVGVGPYFFPINLSFSFRRIEKLTRIINGLGRRLSPCVMQTV